jgi:hypothetical protein
LLLKNGHSGRSHEGEMNRIRTDLIVHWTGRGLPDAATPEGETAYLDRLVSLYEHGLYLSKPPVPDIIRSVRQHDLELPRLPCICFTEVRLREAARFATDYGRLGIGFTREYLLRFGANPVLYLHSAKNGIANTNVAALPGMVRPETRGACETLLAYCKPMNRVDERDMAFYEEHEWRIVHAPSGIPLPPEFVKVTKPDGDTTPAFRFDKKEVRVIIYPTQALRARATGAPSLLGHLQEHTPMMLDFEMCAEL